MIYDVYQTCKCFMSAYHIYYYAGVKHINIYKNLYNINWLLSRCKIKFFFYRKNLYFLTIPIVIISKSNILISGSEKRFSTHIFHYINLKHFNYVQNKFWTLSITHGISDAHSSPIGMGVASCHGWPENFFLSHV